MDKPHYVVRPEPHVFEDYEGEEFTATVEANPQSNTATRQMLASQPKVNVYITERVDYPDEGGILMSYKGVPYKRQGFVFPEAMVAVNNLKRVSVMVLAFLKGKGIRERVGGFLAHYCWLANWMFQFYDPNSNKYRLIYLKENRYRKSVKELIVFINNFLANLKIEVYTANKGKQDFGKVVGTMLEYDNAYHWRMEDIVSETSKAKLLKHPRQELKRLLGIYKQREQQGIEFKAETIVKYLNYLLLLPSVKKAFKQAVNSIDVEKMKMQEDDRYYAMNYEGYNFEGKNLEERKNIWLSMTGGTPPERIFINAQ